MKYNTALLQSGCELTDSSDFHHGLNRIERQWFEVLCQLQCPEVCHVVWYGHGKTWMLDQTDSWRIEMGFVDTGQASHLCGSDVARDGWESHGSQQN